MTYRIKIVADSIGPNGVRLTSIEFDLYKPVLAELNTHGILSRNTGSSRAIPWAKMREKILNHPHIPVFRKNAKGMQPGAPLSESEQLEARHQWLDARDKMLEVVERMGDLDGLNIHKQWLNRLLEPWIVIPVVLTATEWDNFLNLRTELNSNGFPMAMDELFFVASGIKRALELSRPKRLKPGEWHLPYVKNPVECLETFEGKYSVWSEDVLLGFCSAGRCATVSYDNLGTGIDPLKDLTRAIEQLLPNGHMSVFQHQAICLPEKDDQGSTAHRFSGQLRGWTQFRKILPHESCWVSPNAGKELAMDWPELVIEFA